MNKAVKKECWVGPWYNHADPQLKNVVHKELQSLAESKDYWLEDPALFVMNNAEKIYDILGQLLGEGASRNDQFWCCVGCGNNVHFEDFRLMIGGNSYCPDCAEKMYTDWREQKKDE